MNHFLAKFKHWIESDRVSKTHIPRLIGSWKDNCEREVQQVPRTRSVLAHSVDLLTHSQFSSDAKELDPYAILFTHVTFWLTRYSLICMTQDPYILFSNIVNLNWHYLTIDDRKGTYLKSEKSTAILKIQLRANIKILMIGRWPEIDRFPSSSSLLKDPPEISFILCPELAAILDKSQSLTGEHRGRRSIKC